MLASSPGSPDCFCNLGAAGQGDFNDKQQEEELDENYQNPIRAGLVTRAKDWK